MAARLETASRQYGVAVLFSDSFYQLLSSAAQKKSRKLDVVTVKGSAVPMPIYTYDTYQEQKFQAPKLTSIEALDRYANEYNASYWDDDDDLLALRSPYNAEFYSLFGDGINAYLAGDWTKARKQLETNLEQTQHLGGDGPTKTILAYMANRDFVSPRNWHGFRELTSK
jgi:hypothetical protein